MGAALTIVNDTAFDFTCKIGPDEAAASLGAIIAATIGAIALTVVTFGAATPALTTATIGAVSTVSGLTTSAATAVVAAAVTAGKIAGGAALFTSITGLIINTEVDKDVENGFQKIPAGGNFRWNGLSGGLWQQGHCKRYTPLPDRAGYISDAVFMRPIFSGPPGGNNDHNIQFWIDKHGFENTNEIPIELSADPTTPPTLPPVTMVPTIPAQSDDAILVGKPPRTLAENEDSEFPYVCKVCRNSDTRKISWPDAVVSIPGYGDVTCAEVVDAGLSGEISQELCLLVDSFLGPCGCPPPLEQWNFCAVPTTSAFPFPPPDTTEGYKNNRDEDGPRHEDSHRDDDCDDDYAYDDDDGYDDDDSQYKHNDDSKFKYNADTSGESRNANAADARIGGPSSTSKSPPAPTLSPWWWSG